jgi:hypothetical protein
MSNISTDRIVDDILDLEAIVNFHKDYWTGTLWDYLLDDAYNESKITLDTTRIDQLLKESSAQMFDME